MCTEGVGVSDKRGECDKMKINVMGNVNCKINK